MENKELDKIYAKYKKVTNMSATELKIWSRNPKSKEASLSRSPIKRNIRLLSKNKNDWTSKDIKDAKRTISYISRAKGIEKTYRAKRNELTKNRIALRNWGFDIFKK